MQDKPTGLCVGTWIYRPISSPLCQDLEDKQLLSAPSARVCLSQLWNRQCTLVGAKCFTYMISFTPRSKPPQRCRHPAL